MHWYDDRDARRKALGNFLSQDPVLEKIGTDKHFNAFIQTLPSCISGVFEEYVHGDGRSIAAHVRRARNSGTAYKPKYGTLPLSNREHNKQHGKGESILRPKEWFDAMQLIYRERWAIKGLKKWLGLTGEIMHDLGAIQDWAMREGLEKEWDTRWE